MKGYLGLGSPWSRAAFHPKDRDAIEAIIPDDCRIVVTGDAHFRGQRFTLRGYQLNREVIVLTSWQPVEAARVIAERLAVLPALTVTTDAYGWVTEITEAEA